MLTLKNWDVRKTRGGHLYANGNVYGLMELVKYMEFFY